MRGIDVNHDEPDKGSHGRSTWKGQLSNLVICALIVLASLGLYMRESANARHDLLRDEATRVDLQARLFKQELQQVVNHLLVLANGNGLRSFLESGEMSDLDQMAHRARFVSLQQPNYDQIRFLDTHGLEVMRINRGGKLVPREELQNKADRPYFHETAALEDGQVYLSRFDLNNENGRVELPFKPVLRFALPVYDQDRELGGVYVINYLGADLLERIGQLRPKLANRTRLIDSQGHWLKAANPDWEWSFMFPDRDQITFANARPDLWLQVARKDSGQESLADGGVLSWQWIRLPSLSTRPAGTVVAQDEFLVIASEVSGAEINSLLSDIRWVFPIVTSLLLAAVAILSSVFRQKRCVREALHESHEYLVTALNSIGDAVLATDTQGLVTWMNPIAEQLTGWPETEAAGRPAEDVFQVINEQTRQPTEIPISRVLSTGEIQAVANHTVLINRGGGELPIVDSAAPIRDKAGRIIGTVLTFRDMTAENQAQAEREQFFDRSRDLLGIADTNGYFKRINPAFSRTLGWTDTELLSQPFLNCVHPDDYNATLRELEKLAAGQPTLYFENRYRCKDDTWRWLAWTATPQPDGLLYASARDVTKLKQVEEALRDSEEKLAVTLNSIGDGVLATDPDGRVTRLNLVAERFTGWTEAEARGSPVEEVFQVINEQTRQPTEIPVAKVLLNGEICELANHTLLVARDGTERPITNSVAPIWNAEKQTIGIVLAFRDVTNERREQERFEAIVESSLNAKVMIDREQRITLVNSRTEQLFGYARNELLGQQIQTLLPQRFRNEHPKQVEEYFAAPRSRANEPNLQLLGLHKDGSEIPVEIGLSAVTTGEGDFVLASVNDITDRKRAEEALRASEREFRSLAEFVPQIVWITRPDGGNIYFNQHWMDYTGMTLEESHGHGWMTPFHPDDKQRSWDAWQSATQNLDTYELECRLRRADGVYRWWLLRGMPQIDANGKIQKWFGACTDIEDIKRSEEKTRNLNTQIEAANKELESFSYSVSHDLRAPLRHIQGYVEMLVKDTDNRLTEKSQRYLKTVSECAVDMGLLIDDLLEFSRMGRAELRQQSVCLDNLVTTLVDDLKPDTLDRTIVWTVSPLPEVIGDQAMLKQAFVNLLSNAIKYTRPRAIAEIEIGIEGQENDQVILFVRDNGVGFDMKYIDKLFGVFQRLHRIDEFEGTGIGLANVRRIILRHGGRVWAESKLDEGTTLYFTLKPVSAG